MSKDLKEFMGIMLFVCFFALMATGLLAWGSIPNAEEVRRDGTPALVACSVWAGISVFCGFCMSGLALFFCLAADGCTGSWTQYAKITFDSDSKQIHITEVDELPIVVKMGEVIPASEAEYDEDDGVHSC